MIGNPWLLARTLVLVLVGAGCSSDPNAQSGANSPAQASNQVSGSGWYGRGRGMHRGPIGRGRAPSEAESARPSGSSRLYLERKAPAEPKFGDLDRNHDDKLGKDEIDELEWERIRDRDVNGDGVITRDEYLSVATPAGRRTAAP